MPDEPDNSEERKLVRFRRWIAMTPDSKWREFRGTADMVNVGREKDIVELVDVMMLARISHFEQMMSGWEVMRSGLTPNNAGWIYSELMSSLASLTEFETNNFSKKNSWTLPQDQSAFPRYLSDCPVRDGGTMSAITSGQSQLSMVRFVASDSRGSKHDEYLRALFGDFVPKQLLDMLQKCDEQRDHGSRDSEGTTTTVQEPKKPEEKPNETSPNANTSSSSQLTSSESNRNSSNRRKPIKNAPGSVTSAPQCSGIGITFNSQGRGTVTVLGSPKPPLPPQNAPRSSSLIVPPNQSYGFPPLPGTVPPPPPPPNTQVLALLVVERPTGEMVQMGYVPVNCQALVNPKMPLCYPPPPPKFCAPQRAPRNPPRRETTRTQPSSPSSSTSLQNDSGFCSPGEQESTRGNTPSAFSRAENEHLRKRTSAEETLATATTTPSSSEHSVPETTQKLVPTYASVVTMGEMNRPDRISSHVVMENSAPQTERAQDEVAPCAGENTAGSQEQSSNEWKIVKNKHPSVVVVISESKRTVEERTSAGDENVVEGNVSQPADDVEVDEAEEQRIEKRRLRRQRQRAAKVQKRNEEKNQKKKKDVKEEEDGEEPEGQEGETSQAGQPVVMQEEDVENLHSSKEDDKAPDTEVQNSSGQRKFSDNDIIKEEIEDDSDSEEPAELLFVQTREHSKLMFRLLWFDNKRKLDKLYIDDAEKKRLQSLLDMVRIMKDRVDMAGRMIVYRVGRPQISNHIEENIVKVARNLIDVTRHTVDSDMGMARTVCELVGKMAKNFTYLNYVFSILTLPEDFFPKLTEDDPRLKAYKEIITLTHLHMKRVEKIYENLGELYEFKIEMVPKRRRRF